MLNWGRILTIGLIAGIAGGLIFDAFIYLTMLAPNHVPIAALWQTVASIAVGKHGTAGSGNAGLGLILQTLLGIAWGTGYAYIASTRPNVEQMPLPSGLVFGIIVYVIMEFVVLVAGAWTPPSLKDLLLSLVAYSVFFGLPVAYGVRLLPLRG